MFANTADEIPAALRLVDEEATRILDRRLLQPYQRVSIGPRHWSALEFMLRSGHLEPYTLPDGTRAMALAEAAMDGLNGTHLDELVRIKVLGKEKERDPVDGRRVLRHVYLVPHATISRVKAALERLMDDNRGNCFFVESEKDHAHRVYRSEAQIRHLRERFRDLCAGEGRRRDDWPRWEDGPMALKSPNEVLAALQVKREPRWYGCALVPGSGLNFSFPRTGLLGLVDSARDLFGGGRE